MAGTTSVICCAIPVRLILQSRLSIKRWRWNPRFSMRAMVWAAHYMQRSALTRRRRNTSAACAKHQNLWQHI